MTALPSTRSAEPSSRRAVVERLAEEMVERWHAGERPPAEEFFDRLPGRGRHPDDALELIAEELALRHEHGLPVFADDLAARFPLWQAQVRALVHCQQVLGPPARPRFPEPGEVLGDFRLVRELGRGLAGRVYLAAQASLADRPVVLKLAPPDGHEHLSLARLQHTHIVPLYSAHEFADRGLHGLCLPYFGGATLDRTTGMDPDAVCRIGVCLADALRYAHARGLLHLDVKPSNVLVAADGTPMLLDFHLARPPLRAGDDSPEWLGGTAGYMAPGHRAAVAAVAEGRIISDDLDGRADVFALGTTLLELLGEHTPRPAGAKSVEDPLTRIGSCAPRSDLSPARGGEVAGGCGATPAGEGAFAGSPNSTSRGEVGRGRLPNQIIPNHRRHAIPTGLADILARATAAAPDVRYPSAAALAEDLRRHLADQPLKGVRNRSVTERWRKWRRRRPLALPLALTVAAALMVAAALFAHTDRQVWRAEVALHDGEGQARTGRYSEAVATFRGGEAGLLGVPFHQDLKARLRGARQAAERGQLADELHAVCERVRPLYAAEVVSREQATVVEAQCREVWSRRDLFAGADADPRTRADLIDLAVLSAHLSVRFAAPDDAAVRRRALDTLDEAETLVGPNLVLDLERDRIRQVRTSTARSPRTAWEHLAVGRAALAAGELPSAIGELERAVALDPRCFWAHYHLGVCRLRTNDPTAALAAFAACVALAPDSGWCYHNRGLAYAELGQPDRAKADFARAAALGGSGGPCR